jgi:hypothetical protein
MRRRLCIKTFYVIGIPLLMHTTGICQVAQTKPFFLEPETEEWLGKEQDLNAAYKEHTEEEEKKLEEEWKRYLDS